MQFKKLVLASVLILIPAQSMAFVDGIKTAVQKNLEYVRDLAVKYPPVTTGIIAGICAGGIFGLIAFNDYKKKKAEKDFWNKKSDEEIVQLAEKFMHDARDLVEMIKESNQCSIVSLSLIRTAITTANEWLQRLEKRALQEHVEKIKMLASELTQLKKNVRIFVNNDFIEQFEALQDKVNNRPPFIIALPPHHYCGYNNC